MVDVRFQSRDEVSARITELRTLTIDDPSSDMNRLLDEVLCGEDQLLVSTVALKNGCVVGWASAEQFTGQVVAGVFVHPGSRCQGIGSKLVELLLSELDRLRPGVQPKTGPERFWGRFAVRPINRCKLGLNMRLSDIDVLKIGNTIQLAGAVFIGEGKMFICLFPEDRGAINDIEGNDCTEFVAKDGERLIVETLDMDRADWDTFIRQTDLLETEVLTKASDSTLAKVVLRKSQRQIEAGVSWRVLKRDGFACRYCGKDDVPLTVDHLVCWEEGGPSIENNLVAADKRCNKTRGNLPYSQWLEHPYYKKVSAALTEEQRGANRRLVETLAAIPRMTHVRSR